MTNDVPEYDNSAIDERETDDTIEKEINKDELTKSDASVSEETGKIKDGSNEGSERKSYPIILEAKPQHSGPALMKTVDNGKIKEEDVANNSSMEEEQMVVNGVLLPTGTSDGSATIVQYAVAPKIEEGQIQVNYS